MNSVNVLVINGYGINCDVETGWAFEMAGADNVVVTHINRVIEGEYSLMDFGIVVFPGGFSFGDHIASGKVLGLKIKKELGEQITEYVRSGRLMMGICNGFQVMVKMGLLPGNRDTVFSEQRVTLTHNDSARYEDRWVRLKANSMNKSPFLRGIDVLPVSVRHGEGKFMALSDELSRIERENLVAFQYVDDEGEPTRSYPQNPNGSELAVAAITNQDGNVIGMMPHPEVFVNKTQHPSWTRDHELPEEGAGLRIFKNAVEYVRNEL